MLGWSTESDPNLKFNAISSLASLAREAFLVHSAPSIVMKELNCLHDVYVFCDFLI